jgi:hypothetical protein
MGLEPTDGGTTILCLNHLATLAITFSTITLLPVCVYPLAIEISKFFGLIWERRPLLAHERVAFT